MTRLALAPELASVRAHAPEALLALESAYEAARTAIDPGLAEALRERIERAGEAEASPPPPGASAAPPVARMGEASAAPALPGALLDFADQFVVHVAGVTATQRTAAAAVVGAERLRDLARVLYTFDLTSRLRHTLRRLAPAGAGYLPTLGPPQAQPLAAALSATHAAAMRLRLLDPATTELVRLHCAAYHDCKT